MTPPQTRPSRTRKTPTAPKIGANDGPGMWTPGGGAGRIRPLPRRRGPSAVSRQISQPKNRTVRATIAIGMSAMSEPQSGMMNRDVRSSSPFQIWSMADGGPGPAA